jgi:hypothetical protein
VLGNFHSTPQTVPHAPFLVKAAVAVQHLVICGSLDTTHVSNPFLLLSGSGRSSPTAQSSFLTLSVYAAPSATL